MGSIDQKQYIYIDNYKEFGNILFHYADRAKDSSPLMPTLKSLWEKKGEIDTYTLIPGYFDINSKFYECPFNYFYFQLFKAVQIEDNSKGSPFPTILKVYFILFTKDFGNFRKFKLEFKHKPRGCLDFMLISFIAHRLNEYVDSEFDIDGIEESKLVELDFSLKDRDIILQPINDLEIEIFENSEGSRKPGGDDYFWDEAEIKNLPKDLYVKHILYNVIKKRWDVNYIMRNAVSSTDNNIIFRFNPDSAYSRPYPRRIKPGDNRQIIKDIKDLLLIDMSLIFNKIDHFCFQISKKEIFMD